MWPGKGFCREVGGVMRLTRIIGSTDDEAMADRLHVLAHRGAVEEIVVERVDLARRRFRATTSAGRECAIVLPRSQRLFDGAVLMLSDQGAIVVRMAPERWLPLKPADTAAALALGYFAGNMHWRVRFEDDELHIAMDDEQTDYMARLEPLLAGGRVKRCGDE